MRDYVYILIRKKKNEKQKKKEEQNEEIPWHLERPFSFKEKGSECQWLCEHDVEGPRPTPCLRGGRGGRRGSV